MPTDNVYPHVVSETYNVLHSERHRWYYLREQQPDELYLFKSFDNLLGVDPTSAPGTSSLSLVEGVRVAVWSSVKMWCLSEEGEECAKMLTWYGCLGRSLHAWRV